MKYQPKVSTTQKYSDRQGDHIVHEGKLVLLEADKVATVDSNPVELTFPQEDKWVNPIIISETEEIEAGDKVLHEDKEIFQDVYEGTNNKTVIENWNSNKMIYKILSLPEHFSDKHLQAIVDGKMKDEDKVLVRTTQMVKQHDSHNKSFYRVIDLNQQNHITLFPAEQSLEEVAKKFVKDVSCFTDEEAEHFDPLLEKSFIAGAKWAKKNNY